MEKENKFKLIFSAICNYFLKFLFLGIFDKLYKKVSEKKLILPTKNKIILIIESKSKNLRKIKFKTSFLSSITPYPLTLPTLAHNLAYPQPSEHAGSLILDWLAGALVLCEGNYIFEL